MPTKKTTYFCKKCGKEFGSYQKAKAHEESHYKVKKIIGKYYIPGLKAPGRIQVEIDIGGDIKDVFYELVREGWGQ